jgi:protein TonB
LAAATEEVVDFGDAVLGAPTPAVTSSSTHRAAGGTGDGSSPDVFDGGRPPGLAGGDRWDCPYPQEAARAHVDNAVVTLEVRIDVDGGIAHLSVRRDPGYGFGREALRCARAKRWTPGLGKDGRPIVGTALVNVRFERS